MPGYQQFYLKNGSAVWATNEQEARTRWGDQLGEVWDVYLVGHGYTLKGYQRPDNDAPNPPQGKTLRVPNGITVKFYCDNAAFFDSGWEAGIVDGHPNTGFGPKSVPPGNPMNEAEHILVWPSLRTTFRLAEMVRMSKLGDPNTGPVQLAARPALADKSGMCIGSPLPIMLPRGQPDFRRNLAQANWAYLSSILTAIAAAHTPTRVHWCACRYLYPNTSAAFFNQATNPFGIESGEDPRYENN